tara:strand:+ start:85 stop:522 length:438 start_codon:yes stop_codon:yes gene_type:complete
MKNNLKLIGSTNDDLKTISAYCQDAIVKVKDASYLKGSKIFILKLSRFMWEDLEKGIHRKYKRIDCYLRFNLVEKVLSRNINQKKNDRNLELLTIKSSLGVNNIYEISLIFSGDSTLLLYSEVIDVVLDDQNNYWEVEKFPKHKL